jgi:hypothetical protein
LKTQDEQDDFDLKTPFSTAIGTPLIGIILIHYGWRFSFGMTEPKRRQETLRKRARIAAKERRSKRREIEKQRRWDLALMARRTITFTI